ncbi:MAG: CHRD domain-containing protein [Nitrososphaeraceae archaeon]
MKSLSQIPVLWPSLFILTGLFFMSSFNSIYGIQEDDHIRYSSIIVNPDEFYVDNYDDKTQTNEEHHYTFERNNIIEKSDIMEEPRPIYGDTYIAKLSVDQIVPFDESIDSIATGDAFFTFDEENNEFSYEIFLDGMSYEKNDDDVEIIQIHLGGNTDNGPSILAICNEKKGDGHCKEGPGLVVEGEFKEKDMTGPFKKSTFMELLDVFQFGDAYVNIQTDEYPDGELRGQIVPYF